MKRFLHLKASYLTCKENLYLYGNDTLRQWDASVYIGMTPVGTSVFMKAI